MNKQNYKRSFIVGIFIITGLSMLGSGVFMVGSQEKLFKRKFSLKVIFNDVNGLQPGNNVWLSGVKVGTVKKVAFYGNTQVQATISLDKIAETRIFKNALAKISTDGFIGNKIVIIYGGTMESGQVKNGDLLQSFISGASTDDILAMLQQNNKNLLNITNNLSSVTDKIAKGQGTIGGLINDGSLLNKMQVAMKNLATASQKSDRAVANVEIFTARLNNQKGLVNALFTDTAVFVKLSETVTDLKQTVAQLKSTASSAAVFVDKLQAAASDLNEKDNPAGMLLHDEETANDLKETIRNLKSSSRKLDENMEALQHSIFLRGYFRKK